MPFPHPTFARLRLALLALLLATGHVATAAFAQGTTPSFTLRNWRQQNGLPSNEITTLCQDGSGYLWLGTPTGLARFDGSLFLNHDFVPEGKRSASGFASLVADPSGDGLWAAPYVGGLIHFRNGQFEPQVLPGNYSHQRVARLFVAADKALWIAFEGGEVMRLHGGRHEIFGVKDGLGPMRSTLFASDGAGQVWLANGPRLARYAAGALHPVPLPGINENLRIASARQDGPWVLSRGWLHKMAGDHVGLRVEINSGFNARSVQTLLEDSHGAVWTGTRSRGVRRLTLPDQKSDLVIETPEDVGTLLEDGSGNIWVGSNGAGLIRVRPAAVRRYDKSQGLLESHTLGVCEDNAGTIWLANRDGGVAFVNEQGRIRTLPAPSGRDTFSARSVAPVGPSGVWVTTSYGLLRADRTGLLAIDAPGSPPQPPSNRGEMRVTHQARNGDLWVVLDPGHLGRLRDGVWRSFSEKDGLKSDNLRVINEDAQGRIWVGSERATLFRLEGERFVNVPVSIDGAAIQAIYFDDTGAVWIGTAGAGLLRLGAHAGRTLDERHGLPSSSLSQVLGDDQGNLWFGSPQGIFHVRRAELERFFAGQTSRIDAVVLSQDDGLEEATCASAHQPAAWKSRDGLLWFATRQGIVEIDPRRKRVADTPLVVKVDSVRGGSLSWPGNAPVHVPALSRTLELDYSVLCLSTPDRVRARVRLQGYEDDWTPADARGLARYTRLPPGEYHFILEAHLTGEPGTSTRISVPIVVAAAWWQTLWFRLGAAALVLLLGVLAARAWSHRRLRARLAKLESETAIERERTRIARNLHDDLGAGLTRISLLTQTAQKHNSSRQLDKIYSAVSELTQSMDAIVWAVNPQHDDLESVAYYIVEYAQGFLSDAGLRARISLPDLLPPRTLAAQHRHHLFLSCKEALNNAVKHAHASEVSLSFEVTGEYLRIGIADNGRGFSPGPTRPAGGNGLANLHARMVTLGGTCEISPAPGGGTALTLLVPLPSVPVSL